MSNFSGSLQISAIPTISEISIPKFHAGGIAHFQAEEGLALLKDNEMVLNDAQQATLFEYLDGGLSATGGSYTFVLKGDVSMDGFKVGKVVLRNLDDVASFTLRG